MKIISKFKDYYDYLQGIYGVDEKLVLDRTTYTPLTYVGSDYIKVQLYICGYLVEGMWLGGKVLYGDDLLPHGKVSKSRYNRLGRPDYVEGSEIIHLNIPNSRVNIHYYTHPVKLPPGNPNDKENCPILIPKWGFENVKGQSKYNKYPILKQYNIEKVFPPEKIWIMLSDWLSAKNDEIASTPMSNEEKIVSHGFDKKTSFRKM